MKLACFRSVFCKSSHRRAGSGGCARAPPIITFAACESIGLRLGRHGADQVILADVNNDGIADMVVCNTNAYSIYLGNGDGTFQSPNTYTPAGTAANLCAVADVNGMATSTRSDHQLQRNQTGGGVDVLLAMATERSMGRSA